MIDSRHEVCDKYLGLTVDDLSTRHPDKSCVICYHVTCMNYGSKNDTCSKFKYISPEDWIAREIIILD